MKPYTYLLINFLTIIVCFIFSFHPKIKFSRHFGAFIKACIIVAIPFLVWDAWFTQSGVWWFNYDYLLGPEIAGLPLEEILFFICIPFSCVFTYYCINRFFNMAWADRYNMAITTLLTLTFAISALVFRDNVYTLVTMLALIAALPLLHFIVKFRYIGRITVIYMILMLGFIPVNGTLTGTGLDSPIVNYNESEITGFRVLTIPIEDFAYGYLMVLLNIWLFMKFTHRHTDQPDTITA